MADKCNEIVSDVFGIQKYPLHILQNMSNQVDTAIRKNYVRIQAVSNNLNKRPMNKQSYKKQL
jgi:transcription antitermination factor NusA-like protein